jgi:hypothetical protein
MSTKKCNKCHQVLDLSFFSPSGGGNYKRPECKKCNNMLNKKRKQIRELHGQPTEDYICPVCLKNKTDLEGIGGRSKTVWTADHNHASDIFRGHLCHNCNRAIGNFNEDIPRMKRAIEYLENHSKEINSNSEYKNIAWATINDRGDMFNLTMIYNQFANQDALIPLYRNEKEFKEKYGKLSK